MPINCEEPNPQPTENLDTFPTCGDSPNLRSVPFLEEAKNKIEGLGHAKNCDPITTGHIIGEASDRDVIYRYPKALRGTAEAMKELFSDIAVLDINGKDYKVPIIWGSQERAVAVILQKNVRKDNSVVTDRIPLPMLAIYSSGYEYDMSRYMYHGSINWFRDSEGKPGITAVENGINTVYGYSRGVPVNITYSLVAWTMYLEEADQIMVQVLTKFSPSANLSVQGVHYEIPVKITGISNNIDLEPGDQALRVVKYQIDMVAETYIPQPIVRKRQVLKVDVGMDDGTHIVAKTPLKDC